MRVAIRADASRDIGHGHVMRCLALAVALRQRGCEVVFFCQCLPGDALQAISRADFACVVLPGLDSGAMARALVAEPFFDWLVVDHYRLDGLWCAPLRAQVGRILVIDDLANRRHDCDSLLDQNLHADAEVRYEQYVPEGCQMLLGPAYALLRSEFSMLRASGVDRRRPIERVLVCFGGADASNATGMVVACLLKTLPGLHYDVVVGAGYAHCAELELCCSGCDQVSITRAALDMADRMARADLFVGAGGSMTWERAALGLPGVTLSVADNQRPLAALLAQRGLGFDLGDAASVRPVELAACVRQALSVPDQVHQMGARLAALCDGLGAARVAGVLTAER